MQPPSGSPGTPPKAKTGGAERAERVAPPPIGAEGVRARLAVHPNLVWRWTGRLCLALVLALGIGYVPYRIYVRSGLSQYVRLRDELARLEDTNQALRTQAGELRAQLERLHEDDGEIERVARDELGLVRTGEIVFKVE